MDAVGHVVGGEGFLDLLNEFIARRDLREREGFGAALESLEVFVEFEDLPVVDAESFPHAVASLDEGIEG